MREKREGREGKRGGVCVIGRRTATSSITLASLRLFDVVYGATDYGTENERVGNVTFDLFQPKKGPRRKIENDKIK